MEQGAGRIDRRGRVAYQGSLGRNLFHTAELNAAVYGPGATVPIRTSAGPVENSRNQLRRDYGRSNYHLALVLSLERRFSHGLSFLTGFSWRRAWQISFEHRL